MVIGDRLDTKNKLSDFFYKKGIWVENIKVDEWDNATVTVKHADEQIQQIISELKVCYIQKELGHIKISLKYVFDDKEYQNNGGFSSAITPSGFRLNKKTKFTIEDDASKPACGNSRHLGREHAKGLGNGQ